MMLDNLEIDCVKAVFNGVEVINEQNVHQIIFWWMENDKQKKQ